MGLGLGVEVLQPRPIVGLDVAERLLHDLVAGVVADGVEEGDVDRLQVLGQLELLILGHGLLGRAGGYVAAAVVARRPLRGLRPLGTGLPIHLGFLSCNQWWATSMPAFSRKGL